MKKTTVNLKLTFYVIEILYRFTGPAQIRNPQTAIRKPK